MEAAAGQGETGFADRAGERRTVVVVQHGRIPRVELTGAAAVFTDLRAVSWLFCPGRPRTDTRPDRAHRRHPDGRAPTAQGPRR